MSGRGQRTAVQVVAPLAGVVVPLADAPDPVFAGAVVGPGLAIRPDEPAPSAEHGGRVVVVAPCSGRLTSVYPHAVVVGADAGRAVLVHLGAATGPSEGTAAETAVAEGRQVRAGQPLLAWSPARVRAGGRSSLSLVVALQASAADIVLMVEPGERVEEGQPLLRWS